MEPVVELTITPSDIKDFLSSRNYSLFGASFTIKSEDGLNNAVDWVFNYLKQLEAYVEARASLQNNY